MVYKRPGVTLLLVLLFLGSCRGGNKTTDHANDVSDSETGIPIQQTGTSTFAYSTGEPDCDLKLKTINTKFSLGTTTHRNSEKRHVLLKERYEQSGCTNSERLIGMVQVDGWVNRFDSGQAPTWHVQTEGDAGEITGGFYKVTKNGCCGSTSSSVYFNLESGTKLFESRGDLVHIDVPNTDNSRYVAFQDSWSALKPDESAGDPTVIGALEYGSEGGLYERVVFHMKTRDAFSVSELSVASAEKPLEYVQDLELWSADGKTDLSAIGGFKIRIKGIEVGGQNRTPTILIPVAADRLDLEHAVIPNGIEIQKSSRK